MKSEISKIRNSIDSNQPKIGKQVFQVLDKKVHGNLCFQEQP